MHGLVSFSLFGDNPLYLVGAIRNAYLWTQETGLDCRTRFYCGESVPESTIYQLRALGAEVRLFWGKPEDQTSTFWRYDALRDFESYDYVLFRDVDSRPTDREIYAICEWIQTRRGVHTIRDHPFHGVPMLAGLWGARSWKADYIRQFLPKAPPPDFYKTVERASRQPLGSNDFYQVDQWWLRLEVWKKISMDCVGHDEFFTFNRKRWRLSLPERPADNSFIGEGWTEFETPRFPEHRDLIAKWPKRR